MIPVPPILYGTAWKDERTRELTALALANGFSGIDTANQRRHYHEAAVGDALSDSFARGLRSRQDLFLQTKFTYAESQDHRIPYDLNARLSTQVEQSFEQSLKNLKTDYVDSYLLHGPSRGEALGTADREVWRSLELLHRSGRARQIGVSNVCLKQLVELYRYAKVKPSVVQNRCLAKNHWDGEIRAFCHANGICYQGFSLLSGNRRELAQPAVLRIVARTGKSLAQVVFRFAMRIGIVPLTGTTSLGHMRDSLACLDFELEPAEVQAIEQIGFLG